MSTIDRVSLWTILICIAAAFVLAVMAVWGGIKGDAVWQSIATCVLAGLTVGAINGTIRYFTTPAKDADDKPKT